MREYYGYVRVSTVKQGERGSSLHEQRTAIEQYAQRYGLVISAWHEEKETAAKRGRTVFNRMLAALENGKASGVIIHKIDRSARNLRDWSDLGELIDRGIEVHFAHESLDLNSRGGRLSADIQAVVASDYIRNLRDEVRKGFYGRLKQGFYPIGAPLGYLDNGSAKAKTPDPLMAPLVRKAFELYATGQHNFKTLRAELTRLGLRNRRGGHISMNGISTMLNNPFYIGIIRIKKTDEYFQGNHAPLVQKSLFIRVQQTIKARQKVTGLKHFYTYQKMFRCQMCGYCLIAEQQKGYIYYRCHTSTCPTISFREESLEDEIFKAFRALKFSAEDLDIFREEFNRLLANHIDKKEAIMQSLHLQIAQIDDRMEAMTDALVDRVIDKAAYEKRKEKLLINRASLLERVHEISSGNDPISLKIKYFLELLNRFADIDNSASSAEKRDLIKSVTSNLRVSTKGPVITWSSPFNALYFSNFVTWGEPHRGRCRTKCRRGTCTHTNKVKKIAKTVYQEILKDQSPPQKGVFLPPPDEKKSSTSPP